jgi:Redoxin
MDQFGPYQQRIGAVGSLAFIAAQKRSSIVHMPDGDPVEYFRAHPLPYPFLLDEDRRVTHAYGVYKALSLDSINIARPATFVVGRDGALTYVYVGANQTDRAPIEEVLQALAR